MQLDEMKALWAAHGALLARSLAIDERLLRELILRKVRVALLPYVVWMAVEVVFGIAMMLVVLPVVTAHVSELRYVVAAGALAAYVAGVTATSAYLLVRVLQVDYGGPVTAMQRDIERIQLAEYRAFKLAVLGGVALWLPALLVGFEALTGFDALGRVNSTWLFANLALGFGFLATFHLLSQRYVERSDRGPRARGLIGALSGRSLRVATDHLDELAEFEREDR